MKCPYCKNGLQKVSGLSYPCEDCEGTAEVKQCPECGQLLGPSQFDDGSEACRGCIENRELPTCGCGGKAYWQYNHAHYWIECSECGRRTAWRFQLNDAWEEWCELNENNGGE